LAAGVLPVTGVVRPQAVEFFRMIQGGFVTFAFFGQDMQHHRPSLALAYSSELIKQAANYGRQSGPDNAGPFPQK
jgi:hypothetical protein